MPFLPNATAKIYRTTDQINPVWIGFTDTNGRVIDAGGAPPSLQYGDYIITIDHCDYNLETLSFNIPTDTLLAASVGCTSSITTHETVYDHSKLTSGLTLPPGIGPLPYAGAIPPSGWLLCDGSAISRTAYSSLFAVIGTSFGIGDGSTTFNIPDMRGRVPVGIGASGVTNRGDIGGEQAHILTIEEMPSHNHALKRGFSGNDTSADNGYSSSITMNTLNTGGDLSHNNMQPYLGVNYIISI